MMVMLVLGLGTHVVNSIFCTVFLYYRRRVFEYHISNNKTIYNTNTFEPRKSFLIKEKDSLY